MPSLERKKNPNPPELFKNGFLTHEEALNESGLHGQKRVFWIWILAGSLLAGFFGGLVGAAFVAPWYERNILGIEGKTGSKESGEVSQKIILDEESAIIAAVEKVNPAVVSIVVTKDLPKLEQLGFPFDDFFFSVPSPSGETRKQQIGAGSGFIVTSDGMIVTNKHVVADSKAEYTVITKDGKKFPAQILATDPFNDLAVIKVESADLPAVALGDSDKSKLGQRVIAIGNALGEFQNTVTTGVVSGIGRNITAGGGSQTEKLLEVIQTDAAINPGNSGGPLLNLAGEVIGVNTAVSVQAQLIGFAIPINQAKKVIDDVKEFGKVRRPFLGVRYMIVTPQLAELNKLAVDYGALIVRGESAQEFAVVPGSPADGADLKENDILLELNGKKITIDNQLADILRAHSPGDRVILKILSGGDEKVVPVILGEAQ